MIKKLHIDVETFSSVSIKLSGAYKYCESPDFEIILLAYSFDMKDIKIIDLLNGEKIPQEFTEAMMNPQIEKHAHNANFERNCFRAIGYNVPIDQWYCSAVKSSYCGLPLSLGGVSTALRLGEKGKLDTGTALIKLFCEPCKPTKTNGGRLRNLPQHYPEKWEEFKIYCIGDVVAEREIGRRLAKYDVLDFERTNYIIDQQINDRGILIDLDMARAATNIDDLYSNQVKAKLKKITGLENPNSPAQLKRWLGDAMKKEIKSLAKDIIPKLIEEAGPGTVTDVLKLRQKASKASTKKYVTMLNCACYDDRGRGLLQFYGANRTGRWAGRLVQLQNIPRNYLTDLEHARNLIKDGNYEHISLVYDNISKVLSELIRTALIPAKGKVFAVADFSAIEARVIAWLAGEKWRMDVFNSHGKIYEASASKMFNVPIESIGKGSDLRSKGKVAELALGYQGALGAMIQMGGEDMGLSHLEMKTIVKKWRAASPSIVKFWWESEKLMKRALIRKAKIASPFGGVSFSCDEDTLFTHLPSGRRLSYRRPKLVPNKFQGKSIAYQGVDPKTKQWGYVDTYGGKIVENITQALARDLLAVAMQRLTDAGYEIVMHVHDEVIIEIPETGAEAELEKICKIMGEPVSWAAGLPSVADGYITKFYKKD